MERQWFGELDCRKSMMLLEEGKKRFWKQFAITISVYLCGLLHSRRVEWRINQILDDDNRNMLRKKRIWSVVWWTNLHSWILLKGMSIVLFSRHQRNGRQFLDLGNRQQNGAAATTFKIGHTNDSRWVLLLFWSKDQCCENISFYWNFASEVSIVARLSSRCEQFCLNAMGVITGGARCAWHTLEFLGWTNKLSIWTLL